jgi:flagellar hook-length control protein FliK
LPFLQALANAAAPPEGLESLLAGDSTAAVVGSNEPESVPAPAKDDAHGDDLAQLLAALLPGFGALPSGLPPAPPPSVTNTARPAASSALTGADDGDDGKIDAATGLTAMVGMSGDPVAAQTNAGSEGTAPRPPAGSENALELFALLEQPVERNAHSETAGASLDAPAATAPATQLQPVAPPMVDLTQSAALASFHPAVSHTGSAQSNPSPVLSAPVGTPAWSDELGGHVTWMAQRGSDSASLTVSPADLGPIEVRISIHSGQASVWFGAAHADTRTALEQALPRLRELFAAQGMSLADSGVFREAPRQFTPSAAAQQSLGSSPEEPAAAQSVTAVTRSRLGLVDLYA